MFLLRGLEIIYENFFFNSFFNAFEIKFNNLFIFHYIQCLIYVYFFSEYVLKYHLALWSLHLFF
jgi:hypothetical protein